MLTLDNVLKVLPVRTWKPKPGVGNLNLDCVLNEVQNQPFVVELELVFEKILLYSWKIHEVSHKANAKLSFGVCSLGQSQTTPSGENLKDQ